MTTEAIDGNEGRSGVSAGLRVGPYRLIQQLGEGGMGVVHLALDPTGRAVAVKVLRPHVAHDPAARRRLAREVEVLGRIRTPRVAAVVGADLEGDRPYIVTRYVPGPALDAVVKDSGPMHGAELLRLGRGLAEALDAIHSADVIHRDLKPGNVLMLDGDPVLIDFGIAHAADDVRITMTGLVMGTPGYLSPEVVHGAPVTEATDWWGWAATLAFAASGAPPFGRGPMDVVLTRVGRGEADLAGVDPRLAPLLHAALSPDPGQRPDADEVVAALEHYAAGGTATQALGVSARHTQVMDQSATREWERPAVVPLALPVEAERWTPEAWVSAPPADPVQWQQPESDWGEISDGQGPWQEGPGEPDPRIGRPLRTGSLLALLTVLVAAAAGFPVVAALAALVLSWAARTSDRSVTSQVVRRHHRGRRRSDLPIAVVASPWHVVVGALATAVTVILPLLVGICAVFSAALARVAVTGGSPHPNSALPLAVGALIAALMAWWGPGGSGLRRGTRSLVRGISPGSITTGLLVTALLLGAAALGIWAFLHADSPVWWPAQTPGSLLPKLGLG